MSRIQPNDYPQEAKNLHDKAVDLDSEGQYREAIRYYDRALEREPRLVESLINKGADYRVLGQDNEALKCYDRILEINPRYAPCWSNKGNIFDSNKRYEEAIQCYNKALEINPRFADGWYNKGRSLKSLGSYDKAIECLDRALKISRGNPDFWCEKGTCLFHLGNYQKAIQCYKKTLRIDHGHATARKNKALAENKIGVVNTKSQAKVPAVFSTLVIAFGVVLTAVILTSYLVDTGWTNANRGKVYLLGLGAGIILLLFRKYSSTGKSRFLPNGNIVIISRREMCKIYSRFKSARCPNCGSTNLLWYQYDKKLLVSDASIYIRCQNCGHDDYTQLGA